MFQAFKNYIPDFFNKDKLKDKTYKITMPDSFTFSITPYKGYEDEVLRLFHKNRPETQSCEYMNWRYQGEKTPYPPIVCWVHDSVGNKVGMNSLIFRSFLVDGKQMFFAISGDTSLNRELRGRGLGKKLLQFMALHIEKESYACCFGLANDGADHAFLSAGYNMEETLFQYVYLCNIQNKLLSKIKIQLLTKILGKLFFWYLKIKLYWISTAGLEYEIVDKFDKSFNNIWERIPKKNIILRDRSIETLKWRYSDHPTQNYLIFKIFHSEKLIGFIVYQTSKNEDDCNIIDFIVSDQKYLESAMNLFVRFSIHKDKPYSIRMLLNENHRYLKAIQNVGFIKRDKIGSLITYIPFGSPVEKLKKWFVTFGDKDI